MLKCAFSVCIAISLCTAAHSQESDSCSVVLAQELKSKLDVFLSSTSANSSSAQASNQASRSANLSGSYSLNEALGDWMCAHRGSSATQATGGGLNVGIPIHGIPLQFGGDLSSQDSAMWFDQNCSKNSSTLSNSGQQASGSAQANSSQNSMSGMFTNSQIEALASQFMPSQNVEAWKSCMLAKIGSHKSDRVELSYSRNGLALTVKIVWNPEAIRPDAPIVRDFIVFGANCSNPPKPNEQLLPSQVVLCKPEGNSAVTIALNTNQGSAGPIEISPSDDGNVGRRKVSQSADGIPGLPEKFTCRLTTDSPLLFEFAKDGGMLRQESADGINHWKPMKKAVVKTDLPSSQGTSGMLFAKETYEDTVQGQTIKGKADGNQFLLVPDNLESVSGPQPTTPKELFNGPTNQYIWSFNGDLNNTKLSFEAVCRVSSIVNQ